jgi:NADH:ubiquinone oxidoreductase subunit 4 (subunit M)
MGLLLIGLVSFSPISQKGFLLLLVSHGLVSSLLFILVGSLYVRTGTRSIIYYRGLSMTMPIFSILFFISLLLNASFPPSLSF